MASYSALGTSSTNTAGLARAFASVNKLVDVSTGSSFGPSLAAGATEPSSEINTLANVLAACVNSTGGASGDGSTCGLLFGYATPSGGSAPTDTIGAALAIAQNPALNVTSIYNLASIESPYGPTLGTTPTDWTMSINYAGFSTPKSTTVDASGNVWVANSGNNTVAVLAQTGTPIAASPFSLNGLNAPAAVAIDSNGNGWVANAGSTTVSSFTSAGGTFTGSPFTVGTAPVALAFDAPGNLWVANSTSSNITELTSTGAFAQTVTAGVSTPTAIAINPK
jgi:hypothetical protein